jgi:hypothetical protein
MKPVFYSAVFVVILSLYSCTKDTIKPANFVINKEIAIHDCTNFSANTIKYSICFDAVTNESRCPIDAICIWEGYATAQFTLTSGTTNHIFSLSTLLSNKNIVLQNDTTINGINMVLTSLAPYPGELVYNHPPYIASLKITQ